MQCSSAAHCTKHRRKPHRPLRSTFTIGLLMKEAIAHVNMHILVFLFQLFHPSTLQARRLLTQAAARATADARRMGSCKERAEGRGEHKTGDSRSAAVEDERLTEEGSVREGMKEKERTDDDADDARLGVAAGLLDRLEAIQSQASGGILLAGDGLEEPKGDSESGKWCLHCLPTSAALATQACALLLLRPGTKMLWSLHCGAQSLLFTSRKFDVSRCMVRMLWTRLIRSLASADPFSSTLVSGHLPLPSPACPSLCFIIGSPSHALTSTFHKILPSFVHSSARDFCTPDLSSFLRCRTHLAL